MVALYYNKYFILGGDSRNIALAEHLISDGNKVCVYGFSKYSVEQKSKIIFVDTIEEGLKKSEVVIGAIPCCGDKNFLNMPFNEDKITTDSIFELMNSEQTFIAGMIPKGALKTAKDKNITVFDILKREEMAVLNAIPTAEGAIQIAFEQMKTTLHSSNAMILGYGRVGKILAKMLHGIGANVYIAVRKCEDASYIRSFGYTPLYFDKLPQYLGNMDVIFNTVPHIVLDKTNLKYVKKNCVIIDLASKPFGVSFEASKSEGLKVMWAASLPGKVAPVSAANYIKETVYNLLNEMEG